MRTLSALLSVSLCAAFAAAEKPIPSAPLREGGAVYASAEEAAVAGLREAMPLSRSVEHGGAVLEAQGSYFLTLVVTNHDNGHIRFSVVVPRGYHIAAIFHTHPDAGEDPSLFSPNDVAQAKALGVPSYVGVVPDREIKLFDPATMRAQRRFGGGSLAQRGEVSPGRVVAERVCVTSC